MPPSAKWRLTVDSHGSTFALAGITSVTSDLTESPGSGLQYRVDWGDGQTSTSALATHTYSTHSLPGGFEVKAVVTDRFGRPASDSGTVPVVAFGEFMQGPGSYACAGFWARLTATSPVEQLQKLTRMFFESQSSGNVSGYVYPVWVDFLEPRTPFTGTIDGDDNIIITLNDGTRASGYFVVSDIFHDPTIYLSGWPYATTSNFHCWSY